MLDLTTDVRVHDVFQAVSCCLCGRAWDEQFVGVALLDAQHVVGDLCPQCLERGPRQAATQLHDFGTRWRALCERFLQPSAEHLRKNASQVVPELRERISLLAQEGAHYVSI